MYTLEYLPAAKKDMAEAAGYIGVKLADPAAAVKLAEEMVNAVEKLTDMPYKRGIYLSPRPLKHEYRRLLVNKYIIFYYVDEAEKRITVARVVYAKRNFRKLPN